MHIPNEIVLAIVRSLRKTDLKAHNGAQRLSFGDRYSIFFVRPIPVLDSEFLFKLVFPLCEDAQMSIAADGNFSVLMRFRKLAVSAAFIVERIHVGMKVVGDKIIFLMKPNQLRLNMLAEVL